MPRRTQHKTWSADIKRKLFLEGVTIAALAQELKFHRNSLYRAINHGMYPGVIDAISRRYGIPFRR